MVFAANVVAFTLYGMSGAACGARLRASAAGGCGPHGSLSQTTATKSSARAGGGKPCSGPAAGVALLARTGPGRKVTDLEIAHYLYIVRKLRSRLE